MEIYVKGGAIVFYVVKKNSIIAFICAVVLGISAITAYALREHTSMETDAIPFPVVMYHNVNPDVKKKGTYSITPVQFEEDLKYFKEHNYTTVSVQEIINYVYDGAALPENPILLTFDDGYYDNYYYALPLLKQYGMKGVIFVVGSYSDETVRTGDINPNYSYLTWEQMKQLTDDGTFEIHNHTYNMHNLKGNRKGAVKAKGESADEYITNFTNDLNKLQDRIQEATGCRPTAFAYPFGNVDKNALAVLKSVGIKMTVTSYQGVSNIQQGNPESLYQLKRILRTGTKNSSQIFSKTLVKNER